MGFDATRRYRDGKWQDIRLLLIAIVVVATLVLWGLGVIG